MAAVAHRPAPVIGASGAVSNVERGSRLFILVTSDTMISESRSVLQKLGLIALCGLALTACGAGTSGPGDPELNIEAAPTASGDQQSWSTGHALPNPLRVLVTNRGQPMAGVTVDWVTDPGQGVLTPLIATTGSDGIATARWNLSIRVGAYQARATLDGATGSPVVFSASAYPNFAFQMAISSGDGQSQTVNLELSDPLVVYIGDEFNNPFPEQQVEWIVTSGSATVSPDTSVSGGSGLASTHVILGSTPGPVTVLARFPGATSGPRVQFNVTAVAGP